MSAPTNSHAEETHTHVEHQTGQHDAPGFLERNWYWFTIAFAIAFVLWIDNFAPVV